VEKSAFCPTGPNAASDHLHPYLRTAFGFTGITDINIVHVEYLMMMEGDHREKADATARQRIATLTQAPLKSETKPG